MEPDIFQWARVTEQERILGFAGDLIKELSSIVSRTAMVGLEAESGISVPG